MTDKMTVKKRLFWSLGCLLLLSSFNQLQARCFNVIVGGAADEARHTHRSERVEHWSEQAGCTVLVTEHMGIDELRGAINRFIRNQEPPIGASAGDTLTYSFTDHGSTPESIPLRDNPPWERTTTTTYASYQELLGMIREVSPSRANLSFTSHICYPGFHQALFNSDFDFCGATSVDSEHTSYAQSSDAKRDNEFIVAGWKHLASSSSQVSLNDFQYNRNAAMHSDQWNTPRGGSLTSVAYARHLIEDHNLTGNNLPYSFSDLVEAPLRSVNQTVIKGQVPGLCSYTNMFQQISEVTDDFDDILTHRTNVVTRLASLASTYPALSDLSSRANLAQFCLGLLAGTSKSSLKTFMQQRKDYVSRWKGIMLGPFDDVRARVAKMHQDLLQILQQAREQSNSLLAMARLSRITVEYGSFLPSEFVAELVSNGTSNPPNLELFKEKMLEAFHKQWEKIQDNYVKNDHETIRCERMIDDFGAIARVYEGRTAGTVSQSEIERMNRFLNCESRRMR